MANEPSCRLSDYGRRRRFTTYRQTRGGRPAPEPSVHAEGDLLQLFVLDEGGLLVHGQPPVRSKEGVARSDSAATLWTHRLCVAVGKKKKIGRVGFEPTCARGTADFKSAASAVSPPPQGGKDGEIIPKKSEVRQVILFPLFRCKKPFLANLQFIFIATICNKNTLPLTRKRRPCRRKDGA